MAYTQSHIYRYLARGHPPQGPDVQLLITHHFLNSVADGHRPQLGTGILFRGIHGRVELELSGKDKAQAGTVVPTFYSLAGEMIIIPEKFLPLVRAATKGVNCVGCIHAHFLRKPRPIASQDPTIQSPPKCRLLLRRRRR